MRKTIWVTGFFGLMASLALAGCGGSSAPKSKDAGTDARLDGSAALEAGTKLDAVAKLDTAKSDTAPTTDAVSGDVSTDGLVPDGALPDSAVGVDAGVTDTLPRDTPPALDVPVDTPPAVDVIPAVDTPILPVDAGDMPDLAPDLAPDTTILPVDTLPAIDTTPDTQDALTPDAGPAVVFSDNFSDGNSTGWIATATSGTAPASYWTISNFAGNPALEQDSSVSTTRRYMYFNPAGDAGTYTLGDMSVQARVRVVQRNIASGNDFGAKVCARHSGEGNAVYCVAIWPGTTANTGILRVLQGGTTLGSAVTGLDLNSDTWYTVKIAVSGTTTTTIKAYLDGELVATATDTTSPLLTGFAAVGTTGCQAAFDDIVVTSP